MSKPNSGHFKGTTGINKLSQKSGKYVIIVPKGLDFREHPTKYKQLSSKKLKELHNKEVNRTITKEEYKHKEWQRRLTKRRNQGIKEFWEKESFLVKNNLPTTRNWSAEQRHDIISGKIPKYKGKAMQSHHTYSVKKYPHLANRKELIYPATYYEHIHGWHGGSTKNSLPGMPIKHIREF